MLPIFKKKERSPGVALLIKDRTQKPQESQEDSHIAAIEACAASLIVAVHAHDVKAASEAIVEAFDILDSLPHMEGEHINPHSYDSNKE